MHTHYFGDISSLYHHLPWNQNYSSIAIYPAFSHPQKDKDENKSHPFISWIAVCVPHMSFKAHTGCGQL